MHESTASPPHTSPLHTHVHPEPPDAPHSVSNLPLQIIAAMALGIGAAMVLGPKASVFGVLGKLLIQLIKALAVPLVFVAIIEAIVTTAIAFRSACRLIAIAAFNATLAAGLGLALSNIFKPGLQLTWRPTVNSGVVAGPVPSPVTTASGPTRLDLVDVVSGYIPQSILHPFLDGNVVAVVILAILFGCALRRVMARDHATGIAAEKSLRALFCVLEQILRWLTALVPLAVFGVTAKTIAEHGFAPFRGLAAYVAVGLVGLLIHIVIVYGAWLVLFAQIPLRTLLRIVKAPVVYAFGTNSSLATLPLTLTALDELKISRSASRLGACVGTNLNNDGILLYEAMAVLFVAQAHGLSLPLGEQMSVVLLAMVAAVGVAGVPEAGVVSLSLVLTTVGLPLELLPLLLTVDWIIARARSVTNVMSDITISVVLDRWEKRAG